ncbi:ferrochelatase [Liberibacter crescens]|nr:ferrochelatase [Liberibacter crescens]AMC13343.1 ferrochelatase [Liberibacter crescens]
MKSSLSLPTNHPDIKYGKIGVLIVNLGTPDSTKFLSIRRYLQEFLLDRRVVERPRWQWYPILFGIILNLRPQKVSKGYKRIWNIEQNESFLLTHTRNQAFDLGKKLEDHPSLIVEWSMRYGKPSIDEKIESLKNQGCDRILLFPLYPQYAAATTASVQDKAFQKLARMRWQPTIRVVPPYYDDPDYIKALANSVRSHMKKMDWEPEMLIASFHGIPLSYFQKGDPYHCHCQKTGRLLQEALKLSSEYFKITFQSRFGPSEWLTPYTAQTIQQLAKNGLKNLAVITPGFVSDCLETLDEIANESREIFIHNGGKKFTYIPCLNNSISGILLLEKIIRRELMGWI